MEQKEDINAIFDYLLKEIYPKFPSLNVQSEHFIITICDRTDSLAYKLLSNITMTDNIQTIKEWCIKKLDTGYVGLNDTALEGFLERYNIDKENNTTIDILLSILELDTHIIKKFTNLGVTINQVKNYMVEHKLDNVSKKNIKTVEHKRPKAKVEEDNELDSILINITAQSNLGKIEEVYGNEKIINNIFSIFSKHDKNNVILVGDDGVGKTATVKHIANMIRDGEVPEKFKNKQLMLIDFVSLTSGTGFRGMFEQKFKTIVDIASKSGNYIFFIDEIQNILGSNTKFMEVSTDAMLDMILSNKNINFICTTTPSYYSKLISSNQLLNSRLQKVNLNEKSIEECNDIINKKINIYEEYHKVKFTKDSIYNAIKLCKRYITDVKLPTSAIDILDEVGASISLFKKEDERLIKLKNELQSVQDEKHNIINNSNNKEIDKIDELTKKEISLKGNINKIQKQINLKDERIVIDTDKVKEILSTKINIDISELSSDDREKLKNINNEIKSKVIGQDDAVDEVCKAIKRQRVGLSDPNKPVNLLMVGSTGVGKTFLAKKLAESVFGSENNMIRIDMSEYSDTTSLNKLIGAGQGYLGYDDGGVLTEAIKKKPHCVLLLDEIEKANGKIYDMFLQVFDEGRLSDNKGQLINFKNVIILMTSNVGVKEANESNAYIGFRKQSEDIHKRDIIDKSIKKQFKPEFINRIDKIIFFNNLNDENLRNIIKLEIGKISKRVEDNGYHLSNDILDGEFNNIIFNEIIKEREYGARPILREIQRKLVDKLTDFIIDNNPEKGYTFTLNDIYN